MGTERGGREGNIGLPGALPVSRFRLEFRAERPYQIRGYRGSAWRGLMGHALKRLVCITRDRNCPQCMIYRSCVYPYIFETPEEKEREGATTTEAAPHPYVLAVAPEWEPRTVTAETVELTLIGEGTRAAAYVLQALREGAGWGIGAERIPLMLDSVDQKDLASGGWRQTLLPGGVWRIREPATPVAPPMPARARLRLQTPLRIRRENDLVEPERLNLEEFAAAVLRRLALLTRYHTSAMWRMDHAGLRALARAAPVIKSRLSWQDWVRFSNRQGKKIPMGGVIGEMVFETCGLEPVWPLLWIGQWVHAGKGAVMGLGRYRLEAA